MSEADCFSFGGGVQSTAALVLASLGELPFDTFVMADVGHDSENPDTIAYVNEVSIPFAKAHGLNLIMWHRQWRGGAYRGLRQYIDEVPSSTPIPVWLETKKGRSPSNRLCTRRWKIEPIWQWQRKRGASADNPARCGIGISTDEIGRMRTESLVGAGQRLEYPLIDLGLGRDDCEKLTADAGLPPAPKSSCWFCPFQGADQWRALAENHPDLFHNAVHLEGQINDERHKRDRDPATLWSGGPVAEAPAAVGGGSDVPCGSSCWT